MTAATLTRLPVAAGGAFLALTGNLIHWGLARYMRAPLANTGILAMVTFSAMAGTNALFMQQQAHPAPLFAPTTSERVAALTPQDVQPVVPATRPAEIVVPLAVTETTGSVDAAPVSEQRPLGNAEVTEIQRKLTSMQIFDGAVDGIYGPQTARAIKRFEERSGLPARGELSHAVLEAIRAAPVILPERRVEPLPVPDPLPAASLPAAAPAAEATSQPTASAAILPVEGPVPEKSLTPLAAPAPLQPVTKQLGEAAPAQEKPRPLRRELPASPEEAFDLVVETAGEAIETIADGVQAVAMSAPPRGQRVLPQTTPAPEPPAELTTGSIEQPQVGVPLIIPEEPVARSSDDVAVLDSDAKPEDLMPRSVNDPVFVARVQRGLASLGFLHGPADGIAGEATAKAIRNFEVYYNYRVTGRISPELLDLLVLNGASI